MASGGIGRASMLLASGTMVSRVLGFVKAIVLAQTLGVVASVSADSFAIANMLPSSIYSIIAGGVLNAVLVPQVVRAARHEDGGQKYINRLVTLAIVLLAGIALVATVGAPLVSRLYGAGLSSEQLSLVIALAYWCMPQIFFYGLYAVLGEVLNARGLFGPFTWAPVLNNVIGIGFLGVFSFIYGADPGGDRVVSDWTPDMIALLGSTTTVGVACQALILFVFWRRVGLTFRPDFHWRGTGLGKAGRLAGWTFGMLLVMQLSGLIETIVLGLASGANASVAAFQNAYLIFVLPHSIITVSIATAYFTRMSEAASEHRIRDLVRDFSGGARLIGLFIVFAALAIAVISPAFARIFEASPQGVTDMAIILCCFLVGLVTFCGLFLVQRAFYALEDTRTQFWLFLATMPLHIFGMAIVATLDVQFIAAGLALMQSLLSVIRLVVLLWLLRRRIGHLDTRRIVRSYVRFAFAAVIAALVGLGVMWLLGTYAEDGFSRTGIAPALLSCVIGGIVIVAVYFVVLFVIKSPELHDALGPLLRRFGLGHLLGVGPSGGDDSSEGGADAPGQPRGPTPAGARPGGASEWPTDGWRYDGDTRGADESAQNDAPAVGAASDHEPADWRAPVPAGASGPAGAAPPTDRERDRAGRDGNPDELRARDDAWSAWLGSSTRDRELRPINPEVDRREVGAYGGAFASMSATGDLTTAGILLPMHATNSHGPRTRRERRILEQDAARALAERRSGDERPAESPADPARPDDAAGHVDDAGAREAEQARFDGQPLDQERPEQQRMEQQRFEGQRLEQERLEQQRLEQQRFERQRLEQQQLEQQQLDRQRAHEEQLAQERRAEHDRRAEREAARRIAEQQRIAAEQRAAEERRIAESRANQGQQPPTTAFGTPAPGSPGPQGPQGAAARRRARRENAANDRLSDETFREQRQRGTLGGFQQGPGYPAPPQHPAPPQREAPAPRRAPPPAGQPPASQGEPRGSGRDRNRDPDDDVQALFDELFGDDDES